MLDDFLVRATLAGLGVAFAAAPLGCFVVCVEQLTEAADTHVAGNGSLAKRTSPPSACDRRKLHDRSTQTKRFPVPKWTQQP